MVGEFPELQGVIGGYYAAAQDEDPRVAAAIRDHYKPVGQGDEVPTAPVTVAVSLADKLDSIASFFAIGEKPTGSKDPFALRRAALGVVRSTLEQSLRFSLRDALIEARHVAIEQQRDKDIDRLTADFLDKREEAVRMMAEWKAAQDESFAHISTLWGELEKADKLYNLTEAQARNLAEVYATREAQVTYQSVWFMVEQLDDFFADRLKVQQREAGVRHDLIDAVFALGGEADLVRLLARVRALQAFMASEDGANLLTGYRRAANILKKEGFALSPSGERVAEPKARSGEGEGVSPSLPPAALPLSPTLSPEGKREQKGLSYTPEPVEQSLIDALDAAEPAAATAVAAEDFEAAMTALASLRAPIDAFFETVTVNDPERDKRAARLALLARVRAAVHTVADFSRIEG